jgi:hypothetical protein
MININFVVSFRKEKIMFSPEVYTIQVVSYIPTLLRISFK